MAANRFASLLEALPGTPPEDALLALDCLRSDVGIGVRAAALAADARRDSAPALIDQCAALPLPHPLDSEFRFTAEAADSLAHALVTATAPGDEILLVGTPTVALALSRLAEDRRIRFVGPEGCVADALAAATGGRLAAGLAGPGTAAAALVDPPWYDRPMSDMLATCAWACRPGATALLAGPLAGARPGAGADMLRYARLARRLGLEWVGAVGEVRYVTPLFELAAMDQQGLRRLHEWRCGTLVRLTAKRVAAADPPLAPPAAAIELTLDGVRLRLAQPALRATPRLMPVSDDAVFPSVSARAPARAAANFWTSGNRAFRVDGAAALAAMSVIARRAGLGEGAAATRRMPDSVRLKRFDADLGLIDQLCELVDRELDSARRLAGDGAWLKSAQGWRS